MNNQTTEENKKLIEQYPFLLPRSVWTDETIANFDYSWTELDALPAGWRIAFGEEMVKELRDILLKGDFLTDYRIVQIKEKYGELCWYDQGCPQMIQGEYWAWQEKYAQKSRETCIRCGKAATHTTLDCVEPLCDDCA